jgi:hypothetical protein
LLELLDSGCRHAGRTKEGIRRSSTMLYLTSWKDE